MHPRSEAIRAASVSLYADPALEGSPLHFSREELQEALQESLVGMSLAGLPLRTRSKVAKSRVCEALGYAVPRTFPKTQPRFIHPNFDLYVQKSNNLQIWNEEVDPERRYVILGIDSRDEVFAVRVISGQELALMDSTGTLTSKYQANRRGGSGSALINPRDTAAFRAALRPESALERQLSRRLSPVSLPVPGAVLEISALYERLLDLVGMEIVDPGATQDRLRGVELQRIVCQALDLGPYADGGQFPDILCQALEVKLQLSRTVDLGLISPDSSGVAIEYDYRLEHRDVRYAVVYADRIDSQTIRIAEIVLSSGAHFFEEFRRFEGRVQNRKLQLRLPRDFFDVAWLQ